MHLLVTVSVADYASPAGY